MQTLQTQTATPGKDEVPNQSSMSASTAEFSPDKCWYCKKKSGGSPDGAVRVDLYRRGKPIGEEKDAKGKTTTKYAWDTVKFPVPRCGDCSHVHHNRSLYAVGPTLLTLIILGGALVYRYKTTDAGLDPFMYIETLAYGLCGFIFAGSYSGSKLRKMNLSVPRPVYGNTYPVLEKLKADGWVVGKMASASHAGQAVSKKKSEHLPS